MAKRHPASGRVMLEWRDENGRYRGGTYTKSAAQRIIRELRARGIEVEAEGVDEYLGLEGRHLGLEGSQGAMDWDEFRDGAAQAIWILTYASEVESFEEKHPGAMDELGPGPGGNWEDVTPEAPKAAYRAAGEFVREVKKKLSPAEINSLLDHMDANQAGWYGMAQALGHGIGWFDYDVKLSPPHFGETVGVLNAAYKAVQEQLQ